MLAALLRIPACARGPSEAPRGSLGDARGCGVRGRLRVRAGSLFGSSGLFRLVDAFGVLPFLVFAVSPIVFRTPAQRNALLAALLSLGRLSGRPGPAGDRRGHVPLVPELHRRSRQRHPLRAGARALRGGGDERLCPLQLLDRGAGRRIDVELPQLKALALLLAIACMGATFLTLQRSVWLATGLAILAALLVARDLRSRLLPTLRLAALVAIAAVIAVPGLGDASRGPRGRRSNRVGSQEPEPRRRQHDPGPAPAGVRMGPVQGRRAWTTSSRPTRIP